MKFLKIHSFLALLMISAFCSYAQQSKRIRNIEGRCEISRHITLEEAEQKALVDAKTNALRKAGVPDRLWTVTGLISQDDGSEFSQILSKMTTLQIDGFVSIRDVSYSEEVVDGKRYAVATIDADVRRGEEVDPTFVLSIDSMETVYKDGEPLKFNATIYGHDAYIHIFWFDENGGSIVFPNQTEPEKIFLKDRRYTFPTDINMQYTLWKKDKSRKFETINLIAVASKRDIPFIGETVTFESVLKWLYSIPADERAAWRDAVVIQ